MEPGAPPGPDISPVLRPSSTKLAPPKHNTLQEPPSSCVHNEEVSNARLQVTPLPSQSRVRAHGGSDCDDKASDMPEPPLQAQVQSFPPEAFLFASQLGNLLDLSHVFSPHGHASGATAPEKHKLPLAEFEGCDQGFGTGPQSKQTPRERISCGQKVPAPTGSTEQDEHSVRKKHFACRAAPSATSDQLERQLTGGFAIPPPNELQSLPRSRSQEALSPQQYAAIAVQRSVATEGQVFASSPVNRRDNVGPTPTLFGQQPTTTGLEAEHGPLLKKGALDLNHQKETVDIKRENPSGKISAVERLMDGCSHPPAIILSVGSVPIFQGTGYPSAFNTTAQSTVGKSDENHVSVWSLPGATSAASLVNRPCASNEKSDLSSSWSRGLSSALSETSVESQIRHATSSFNDKPNSKAPIKMSAHTRSTVC